METWTGWSQCECPGGVSCVPLESRLRCSKYRKQYVTKRGCCGGIDTCQEQTETADCTTKCMYYNLQSKLCTQNRSLLWHTKSIDYLFLIIGAKPETTTGWSWGGGYRRLNMATAPPSI